MANLLQQGDQFIVASKEPAFAAGKKNKVGYGANGFTGSSSDVPGEHTTSGFLPQTVLPAESDLVNHQTRKIDASPYPTHPGMSARADSGKIPAPPHGFRPSSVRVHNVKK